MFSFSQKIFSFEYASLPYTFVNKSKQSAIPLPLKSLPRQASSNVHRNIEINRSVVSSWFPSEHKLNLNVLYIALLDATTARWLYYWEVYSQEHLLKGLVQYPSGDLHEKSATRLDLKSSCTWCENAICYSRKMAIKINFSLEAINNCLFLSHFFEATNRKRFNFKRNAICLKLIPENRAIRVTDTTHTSQLRTGIATFPATSHSPCLTTETKQECTLFRSPSRSSEQKLQDIVRGEREGEMGLHAELCIFAQFDCESSRIIGLLSASRTN